MCCVSLDQPPATALTPPTKQARDVSMACSLFQASSRSIRARLQCSAHRLIEGCDLCVVLMLFAHAVCSPAVVCGLQD